ncbi:MAG: asparagine synthase-related protein [Thermoplasmata archaeon]
MDEWGRRLAQALAVAVDRSLAGAPGMALAFSGGLDSSLLALLASRRKGCEGAPDVRIAAMREAPGQGLLTPGTRRADGPALSTPGHHERGGPALYTVGTRGARDIEASRRAAQRLGLEARHVVIEVGEEEVLEAARGIRELSPSATRVELAFTAPLYIVCARARERAVVTGDGADELFGGYHRYLRMGAEELESALRADLDRLLEGGIQRHRAIARRFGRELVTPYLDDEVVELARLIPPAEKVAGGERKVVLRRAARILGLPEELCAAPKRAAQYGAGVMRVLEKHSAFG